MPEKHGNFDLYNVFDNHALRRTGGLE